MNDWKNLGIVLIIILNLQTTYSQNNYIKTYLNEKSVNNKKTVPFSEFQMVSNFEKYLGLYATVDSLESLYNELYKRKIETDIEIKVGIELYRKMFTANIGLPIILSRNFSLVPELSFISAPIISGSVRYKIRLSKLLDINIQGGFGYIPGFPFSFVDAPCGILALSGQYNFGKKFSLVLELKTVFIQNTINTNTLSIEGYDIIRNPPTSLSIGVSF
jgi:hypothetical protein